VKEIPLSEENKRGKIVLVQFPFTNMTNTKIRPALVIYVGKKDAIVALISSKIPALADDTQVVIKSHDRSFKMTGLKTSSVIKLDKITTIDKSLIYGELGEIDDDLGREINEKISNIYRL
jgi:mRNA interferase MazF